jgi:hypothetical protein
MKQIKYLIYFLPSVVLLTLAFCFKENKESDPFLSQALVDVLEN